MRTDSVERIRRPSWGGDARYTDLIARRGAELVRVALLVTGNRHDAEDAVQDAVMSVAKAWPRLTERAAYAYLRTAVVRKALDGKRHPMSGGEPIETAYEDERFLALERDRRFVELVQELPPQQRAVVVLRYYADVDDRVIAKTLGCSVSTVRSQASRALDRLRTTTGLEATRNSAWNEEQR